MSKNDARKRKLQILNKLTRSPIKLKEGELDDQIRELDRILEVTAKNTKRLANKKSKDGWIIYKKTTLADKVYTILKRKFQKK